MRTHLHAPMLSILVMGSLLAVGTAQAQVTLRVTPTNQLGELLLPGSPLMLGDQLVLDIQARNDGTSIAGLGASATGYDPSRLSFDTGATVQTIFAALCIPATGCFGGLDGSSIAGGPLVESTFFGSPQVRFFNHIALAPTVAPGSTDLGVDGLIGTAQARLFFDVISPSTFQQDQTVTLGALAAFGDALVLPSGGFGSVETIWVVPEPGTALLLGLGLAGLARRREVR